MLLAVLWGMEAYAANRPLRHPQLPAAILRPGDPLSMNGKERFWLLVRLLWIATWGGVAIGAILFALSNVR